MHKKENTHILDQHTLAMDLIELQNTCKKKLEQNNAWKTQHMTLCKYECMILSHDVSNILTACRMLQISIAQRQVKAKIHSFPKMYILGGVDVVEMGQIKVFVQK